MIAIRPLPIEVKVICSSVSIRLKQYKTIIITITEIMANLPQTEFPFNLPRQSSNFFFNCTTTLSEISASTPDNTGKEIKYGTPEGCDTGILKDSEELQAIIKKDWGKKLVP
jgi:hypothetical protein